MFAGDAVGGGIALNVLTTGATDPYRGYSLMVHFDETIVNAVSATNAVAGLGCNVTLIDNSNDVGGPDGSVMLVCSGNPPVSVVGTLATFNFDVIDNGDPALCIRAFTAGNGGPIRGTYTFGTDIAAQAQTLSDTCGLGDPAVDSDGDGCANVEEGGGNPDVGGLRNPLFPYDFYDVNGSGHINLVDINMVRANFSAPNPTPPEDEFLDRGVGTDPWAPGAPDGVINLIDINLVRAAFNDDCRPAP